MSTTPFDLVIIGGGITGAGIALDATTRGLKTALIEMQDFAAGTSSRSTKLIHGGLRYLKQLEFGLVRQVGRERAIVHRNAPHVTQPERMLLPLTRHGSLGKTTARVAMWIYERLARVKRGERFRYLNREKAIKAEPLLDREDLIGAIMFYEYRTDDARLTIEVMKEAAERGVVFLNYAKAVSFLYQNEKITGLVAEDTFTGKQFQVKAAYVVNAAGPWVDEVDRLDKKAMPQMLSISKGVHLVVDHPAFPVKQSVYFDTPDKRMIFAIPRNGKTYFGTTDDFYEGDLAHPQVTKADREYLLNCVNTFFPQLHLKEEQLESCWAGLRPLVKMVNKKPSEISRKDEMFVSDSGLITIAGGKLTGYRKMAQRVVDLIALEMRTYNKRAVPVCTTDTIALSGAKPRSVPEVEYQQLWRECGFERDEKNFLDKFYGTNSHHLLRIAQQKNTILSADKTLRMHQVRLLYALEYEYCFTVADYLLRRTGLLYFKRPEALRVAEPLHEFLLNNFTWTEQWKRRSKHLLETAIKETENTTEI